MLIPKPDIRDLKQFVIPKVKCSKSFVILKYSVSFFAWLTASSRAFVFCALQLKHRITAKRRTDKRLRNKRLCIFKHRFYKWQTKGNESALACQLYF